MSETRFVFCENCKHVFEVDIDSHINECPLCNVPNSLPEVPECVANELTRRDDTIARLKEDGERLAVVNGYYCCNQHENYLCHLIDVDTHATDCPITLHRALWKELENK